MQIKSNTDRKIVPVTTKIMINELLLARRDAVIYYLVRGGLGFKIGVRTKG